VGPLAALPFLRARRLLRFVGKQACDETLQIIDPSVNPLHRAGGVVDVVLRRRDVAGRTRRGIVVYVVRASANARRFESELDLETQRMGLALVFAGIGQWLDSASGENLFELSHQCLMYQPV
jgi:hypothetical protein